MSTRKNVSWRVIDSPQRETINKWLDAQKNIQDSLTNIVLHMIERFGIRNITDYDIQKMLYQQGSSMAAIKQAAEVQHNYVANPLGQIIEANQQEQLVKSPKKVKHDPFDLIEDVMEDDIYNEIDIKNL